MEGTAKNSLVEVKKKNYEIRKIEPAKKSELLSVAKAMHREKFSSRVQKLFSPETEAAQKALQTGIYIGWRIPDQKWDCIRVNEHSICFCGHKIYEHRPYEKKSSKMSCMESNCSCTRFRFIPSRPEDIGAYWLLKRPSFDVSKWKVKCKCKHSHVEHKPTGIMNCLVKSCKCSQFRSDFLCVACDKHWEEHDTFFETEETRRVEGLPFGEAYLPFAELPSLRNMALTGDGQNSSTYHQLVGSKDQIPKITL